MRQWSYLWISLQTGTLGVTNKIKVQLTSKGGIDEQIQEFVKTRATVKKFSDNLQGFDIFLQDNIKPNQVNTLIAETLDFLGSLGWEAYACEGGQYYFKKPVES